MKQIPLNDRMKKYNEKMKSRVKGRQPIQTFYPGQHVLIANHIGRTKWITGEIVRQVTQWTYFVRLGTRVVKRHIDDIIACSGKCRYDNLTRDDEFWMHQDITDINENNELQMGAVEQQPQNIIPRKLDALSIGMGGHMILKNGLQYLGGERCYVLIDLLSSITQCTKMFC